MTKHAPGFAIRFKEGAGYVLVKALRNGTHSQVSLVRSIADDRLYVRKKQFPNYVYESNDARFANVLPTSYSPRLVERIKYHDGSDALYFEFCNGGDLGHLIECYRARAEPIPEEFIWYLFGQMTSLVAYLRYGLIQDQEIPKGWDPIHHRDLYQGNFLLHWPDFPATRSRFPDLLICDWGHSLYHSQGLEKGESPEGDFFSSFKVLFCLCLGRQTPHNASEPIIDTVETLPYSKDLKQLLIELEPLAIYSVAANGFSPEMAKRYITLSESKLTELADSNHGCSLRYDWTRPDFQDQPFFFGSKIDYIKWLREQNKGKQLSGYWCFTEISTKNPTNFGDP